MKKLLLGFLVLTTLLTSCGSDEEDCTLTELDEIIIGDWTLNGNDVTFQDDGNLIDEDNVFEASINGVDLLDKSYTLEGDTVLNIRCSNANPPAALTSSYSIIEYDCNEIKADNFITFTFKRK